MTKIGRRKRSGERTSGKWKKSRIKTPEKRGGKTWGGDVCEEICIIRKGSRKGGQRTHYLRTRAKRNPRLYLIEMGRPLKKRGVGSKVKILGKVGRRRVRQKRKQSRRN